jgi:hypothetical protein
VESGLRAALAHDDGTYGFDDVVSGILSGHMQLWRKGSSAIVTQVLSFPKRNVIRVFLAYGDQETLAEMEPLIEQWALAVGCTEAMVVGRKGWARSYLKRGGWQVSPLVVLTRKLGAQHG